MNFNLASVPLLDLSGFFSNLYNHYTERLTGLTPFLKFAAACVIFFSLLTLIIYFYIFFSRRRDHYLTQRNKSYRKKVVDIIIQHIILNPEVEEKPAEQIAVPEDEFRELGFRKRWARQILIDEFVYYHINFAGKVSTLLRRLFLQLGLEKNSFAKLNSRKWNKKIKGLHELAELQLIVPDVKMLELSNSRNRVLRMEARAAYIQLIKNEPFKFFDQIKTTMLDWEQLYLFEVITKSRGLVIPSFSRWLNAASNNSLIIFCLKLIVHYNQFNTVPSIRKLLDHPDIKVRAAAINALGQLEAVEAEPDLINMYIDQPRVCQLEILKALGRIGSGENLSFLREEFMRTQDYDIRKNAAKSIIEHKSLAKEMVDDLLQHIAEEKKRTLKHCMDPLIKY